mmetsp:Transcript_20644/g.36820  ORF Transcript_20644/g.36820 Transcript_20644/m.36820 type:complete len:228 (+) Transcript_20644:1288-1971(+)
MCDAGVSPAPHLPFPRRQGRLAALIRFARWCSALPRLSSRVLVGGSRGGGCPWRGVVLALCLPRPHPQSAVSRTRHWHHPGRGAPLVSRDFSGCLFLGVLSAPGQYWPGHIRRTMRGAAATGCGQDLLHYQARVRVQPVGEPGAMCVCASTRHVSCLVLPTGNNGRGGGAPRAGCLQDIGQGSGGLRCAQLGTAVSSHLPHNRPHRCDGTWSAEPRYFYQVFRDPPW